MWEYKKKSKENKKIIEINEDKNLNYPNEYFRIVFFSFKNFKKYCLVFRKLNGNTVPC